ncbi:MAG: hypothetical protein HOE53_00025 [Candidatus Magasanikbacteria bacterium]|jgi:hypothetical protein|nr:hypothetical protein [Candidatus Magasanikbacteria bacterium]
MNRFTPWILGGIAAVGATVAGTYAVLNLDANEYELSPEDVLMADCTEPDDIVPIIDLSLREAMLEAIEAETGVREQEVWCESLAQLERLEAQARGIFDLTGLEYAQSLKHLDLSENIILEPGALRALFGLEYLNLNDTTLAEIDTGSSVTIKELFLEQNGIGDISFVREYTGVTHLGLQHNVFVELHELEEMLSLQFLAIYGAPLDWSHGGAAQVSVAALQAKGIDVIYDELELGFGVGNTQVLEKTVEAPGSMTLVAEPTFQKIDSWYKVREVEFYEVHEDGVLITMGVDEDAPYSMAVFYDENDIGVHKYAAEVRMLKGANATTQPDKYVRIEVKEKEEEPDCRVDADCSDAKRCTIDACIEGACTFVEDYQCIVSEAGLCSDGKDNDADGSPDCDDSDCFEALACNDPDPAPYAPNCKPLTYNCGTPAENGDTYCSLRAQGNGCSAAVFTCKNGVCKKPGNGGAVDVSGCDALSNAINGQQPNAPIAIDGGDYNCGNVYMCTQIVLCAKW